jgi:hypothetical protein
MEELNSSPPSQVTIKLHSTLGAGVSVVILTLSYTVFEAKAFRPHATTNCTNDIFVWTIIKVDLSIDVALSWSGVTKTMQENN